MYLIFYKKTKQKYVLNKNHIIYSSVEVFGTAVLIDHIRIPGIELDLAYNWV